MDRLEEMQEFWDARALEDPFYFVDNRVEYGQTDRERFWAAGREQLDYMLEALGARIEPADEVVEIGCGIGRLTRVLAERSARVIALDVSQRMLDSAQELNPGLGNVRWILGDGATLAEIGDGTADVCQSYVVFPHIPEPEITLGYVREIGRVLRPGGWAAVQVSNQPAFHRRRRPLKRLRLRWRSWRHGDPSCKNHAAWRGSSVDLDLLRKAANEAAMDVQRVVGEGRINCLVLLRKRQPGG